MYAIFVHAADILMMIDLSNIMRKISGNNGYLIIENMFFVTTKFFCWIGSPVHTYYI